MRKLQFVFRSLYDWTLRLASHKNAEYALFLVAFVESSFFPIPPDVLLIVMLVALPTRWVRYALFAATGSIIGGIFGYGIGFLLYTVVGAPIIHFYGLEDAVTSLGARYEQYAFLTVFSAAFTPIPYKVITISAGIFKISFAKFFMASIIGRGMRFFIIAVLFRVFGARIKVFIDRYFNILTLLFLVLLIGGFVALKFLF